MLVAAGEGNGTIAVANTCVVHVIQTWSPARFRVATRSDRFPHATEWYSQTYPDRLTLTTALTGQIGGATSPWAGDTWYDVFLVVQPSLV